MTKSGRIPFDALCVAAIANEIHEIVGAKVQGVRQPDASTVVIELYHRGGVHQLLLSSHPEFFRAHFVTRKPGSSGELPVFCATLRARLDGATLHGVRMQHSDRVLVLDFDHHLLIAELMGKHSNLILIDEQKRVISAAKWVPESQSSRPILPNRAYSWPPVLNSSKPTLDSFKRANVHSKFGKSDQPRSPGLSLEHGAYPVSLAAEYPAWLEKPTFSIACEQAYTERIRSHAFNSLQQNLSSQLERALLGREVALQEVTENIELGGKASTWQRYGELLMAYAANLPGGSTRIKLPDYDGTELEIKLDPALSGKENALKFFEKAKKAKSRLGILCDQAERLQGIKAELEGFLFKVLEASRLDELQALESEVRSRRLLQTQQRPSKDGKAERPFDGHRIRELIGPGNARVLYGENAEANDYLTLRVAKSNDWWLHVRGHTSAHVIIPTQNKPDLTSKALFDFAAKVAVQNSPQKHAGYVPVDITLKKYVRRIKGSPKGTVVYTHERTIHVDGL